MGCEGTEVAWGRRCAQASRAIKERVIVVCLVLEERAIGLRRR